MDRTTKILLAAIALGLWANAGVSALRSATAQVSPQGTPRPQYPPHDADLNDIERELLDINLNLTNVQLGLIGLEEGHCRNRKLCGP
jgi:hypothetical protein